MSRNHGFKLLIETGNAAFDDEGEGCKAAELARILRDVAERLLDGATSGMVRDINGNIVGSFSAEGRS